MNEGTNLFCRIEPIGNDGRATSLVLDVRDFVIDAEMNRCFAIKIVAASDDPALDLEALIGQAAAFAVATAGRLPIEPLFNGEGQPLEGVRMWGGIVKEMRQISVEPGGLSLYEIEIVPRLWLLSQRTNNSIFQHLSEFEISEKLLKSWDIDFSDDGLVAGGVDRPRERRREYRTQWEETDLAFMDRMLEEAGISYHFDSSSTWQGLMVLAEAPQRVPPRARPLTFQESPNSATGLEWATDVKLVRRVTSGKVSLLDHDFRRRNDQPIMASAKGGQKTEEKLEVFDYRDGYFLYVSGDAGDAEDVADKDAVARTDPQEAKVLAEKRLRAHRAHSREVSFRTNCFDIDVGHVVSIEGHSRPELAKGLLVTGTHLYGSFDGEWSLEVIGVSIDEAYRPPFKTPRPLITGVESATVVGPDPNKSYRDRHGRVKVFFHWDRDGIPDEHSSCWMHVSQPMSGASYGTAMLPRPGQEVLVAFLGSDPDRPIIVGRYHTSVQMPPFDYRAEDEISGMTTNAVDGSGKRHKLMMNDTNGTITNSSFGNRIDHTAKHRASTIGNSEKKSVGDSRTEGIGDEWSVSVGKAIAFGAPTVVVIGTKTMYLEGMDYFQLETRNEGFIDGDMLHITGKTSIRLEVGPSSITLTKDGIDIQGPLINLNK